jgi:hypothetical protein
MGDFVSNPSRSINATIPSTRDIAEAALDLRAETTSIRAHTDGWVNVRTYGAVGDGITDDYPAFLAAVKAIGARGGGTVLIPEGTYALTRAVPFINGLRLLGAGYGSRLKAIGVCGVLGEAYPSQFCVLNGWIGNSRFNYQYDATIAGYQTSDGSVTDVVVENLRIDGNKSGVSLNSFDSGNPDDAYQNGIRLDRVQRSHFRSLWVENTPFNALSNYDGSDDNVWETIRVENPGGVVGAPAYTSGSGVYVEYNTTRTRFVDITIVSPAQYGVLVKAAGGGTISDVQLRGIIVIGAARDGVRIGDDADTTGIVQRTTLEQVHLLNCGTATGYVGLRVAHSATTANGYVTDTVLSGVEVTGGGDSGGVVLVGATKGYVQRTLVNNVSVTGVTGTGFRMIGSTVEDSMFTNISSIGNGGIIEDIATRTRIAGILVAGSSTFDFYTTPRIATGASVAPEVAWNRDSVGSWSAGVGSPNKWYLYGLGAEQFWVTAGGANFLGDLISNDSSKGIVLKSPDGSYWRGTISNAGAITWTKL